MVVGALALRRRTGSCYKHIITAENSTTKDSSYFKEGFILRIRFVETGLEEGKRKEKKEYGEGRGGGKMFQKLNR